MTTLRGTIFDRIDVWGQPWHGRMDQAGVLDLGGGKTKTSTYIPQGGQAQLVQFAGLPVPVDKPCDTAEGASWKNWAILAGNKRQYMPLHSYYFDINSWLYRTADGTVWCLQLWCFDPADPVVIRARRINQSGDMWQTVFTGLAAYKPAIRLLTQSEQTAVSASKTGDRALVNLGQPYTYSISITSNPNWIDTYTIRDQPTSSTFAEITVGGGSSTQAPTVNVSMLTSADVFSHQPYAAYSNATVRDHAKWMVGAWMQPDGIVCKTYVDLDITRTLTGNGTHWSAMTGLSVTGKLVVPSGDVPILSISSSATVDSNGGYLSTTTTTTPPGATTNTQAGFGIAHSATTDGAVQKFQVTSHCRVIGGLGQQINPVAIADFNKPWCQHPITGELTFDGHFF